MSDCGNEADELTLLAAAIAIISAKVLTIEQLNVYGNFIVAVGSLMLTIAAQEEAMKSQNKSIEADYDQQIRDIKNQLMQLLPPGSAGDTPANGHKKN